MGKTGIISVVLIGALMGVRTVFAQSDYFKSATYTPAPLPVFKET